MGKTSRYELIVIKAEESVIFIKLGQFLFLMLGVKKL